MLDRVVGHRDLLELIDALRQDWRLIGPVAHAEPMCDPPVRFFYEPVARAQDMDLRFTYCVQGPKRFLLPARETLFEFSSENGGFAARPRYDTEPLALVGVHPCDIHAIQLLDHVFHAEVRDEHYLARREQTFLVGLDCASPCTDGVFCRDMHCNAADSGFDVMLYPLDRARPAGDEDRYGVVFGSDSGRAWMSAEPQRTRSPSARDERDLATYQKRKDTRFPFALRTRLEELPDLLTRSYDSLLWEATARRCYSCGSCNLTCPTCYCFDIEDVNSLEPGAGTRERSWDGCQLTEFALVAGGHNFRPKAAQRLRHRIYRKGMWIQQRTGLPGCVGCARCDRACTARIHSVAVYNQLAEEA